MYNIIADLHTHTTASTHAYSSAKEMIDTAAEKGLYAIGLTDHGYQMPGAPGTWHFENLIVIPPVVNGVRVYRGMEANVLNFNADLDHKPHYGLEFVVASVHNIPNIELDNPTVEKCTEMYLKLAQNPYVNIVGHCGTKMYEFDYERVIPVFKENNILVEINSHTFKGRPTSTENCIEIARICKKISAPIVVNSDAHFCTSVGEFGNAVAVLEKIDFPEELIVNADVNRLQEYMAKHANVK